MEVFSETVQEPLISGVLPLRQSFGGFDMKDVTPGDDWVRSAYANGVSMGGELKAADANGAPTFVVWAIKDAESAHLDRIQIVKGDPHTALEPV